LAIDGMRSSSCSPTEAWNLVNDLGLCTGGSCRIPASVTGVLGFRPTTGCWLAGDGIVPMSTTRDTVGMCFQACVDNHISLISLLLCF
jgi:Asp-tRNA(Asn)/Glu-tRNA(Gln) amidotransferase A subunit family amidase